VVGLGGARRPAGPSLAELGGWPQVLGRLIAGHDLSAAEARAALAEILSGDASPVHMASFLTALRQKGETVEEIATLARTALEFAEPLAVPGDLVDTCGTGGDRSRTINVSTIAALVVAGAGARVCKHGNRAASSAAGSADVLEALGVAIDLGPAGVARCVEEAGMGFCFAPRFHAALRHAGPVRRELGVATVFNFLGPLTNPARPRRQVVGLSDPSVGETLLGVLRANGAEAAMVVWGHDGLDELSVTGPSSALWLDAEGGVRRLVVDPAELGIPAAGLPALQGGDAAANAAAARRVLAGERGPQRDVVALNAAAGAVVAGIARDLSEGLEAAFAAIDDGRAASVLERLRAVSQAAAAEEAEEKQKR
jgi:anthranilate phosphoribosyltransferase